MAFNAGVLAFKAKDYATATAKFEEALSYDPYLRQAWAALSQVHLEQKRYREAAEAADKAVALGATDESVLRARWEAYRNLGDEAKAAKAQQDLERSRSPDRGGEEDPQRGGGPLEGRRRRRAHSRSSRKPSRSIPASSRRCSGSPPPASRSTSAAEAAAAAETLLKADPRNEQAIRIRYNAALKLGDKAMIVDSLVGLAAVDPATARDSLFKLATAAYDADDVVDAKAMLGKVLELDPNHARSHYYLGLILMREGAKPEAKSHLERFLALAPNDPDVATARDALKYMREH